MIRALIVDDDQSSIDFLANLLAEKFDHVDIVGTATSVAEALSKIVALKPNLIFLDIVMPGKGGFELLEQIDKKDFEVIFTTGYDQYAIKAIRFSALDYLLKPIDPVELEQALNRVKEHTKSEQPDERLANLIENFNSQNQADQKLSIPTSLGYDYLKVADIIRCESDSNYTKFYMVGGNEILVSKSLKEFDEILAHHNFFRVHKSHLVNIAHVKKYLKGSGGQAVMADGATVDVSHRKKEAFLERLNNLSHL